MTRTSQKIMEEVTSILQERSTKAFETAKGIILSEKRECKELNEAFEYYVKNWIDYMHVGLISLACEAVNGDPDSSISTQVTMLFLAAAIDIHDDIIDGSKTKHGKPTVFGKFGKDIALLVGDAFLIKALTILHKSEEKIPPQKIKAVWEIINSLFFELGDAEALEASIKGNTNISAEKCFHILEKKASNFEIHMRIGAVVGNGEKNEIDMLGNYGRILGILAAVREDFIDTFEADELQNRMKNECLPLPVLYAFENPQIQKTVMSILAKPKISDKDAEKIVDAVSRGRSVKDLKNKLTYLSGKALSIISNLRNESVKSQLKLLTLGALEDL